MPKAAVPDEATVAIVGAGPAGLTLAMLLAQRGIDIALFERRSTTSHLPRAHLLNVRTMEVFRELGLAKDVSALSPPEDRWHRVAWYTSLAGPTPQHGVEIGHRQAWGGGSDAERYAAAGPERFANVPQLRLDGLLRRHADRACPGRILFDREVVGIEQDDSGATLAVVDRATGATHEVHADYVIAADGGRTVADLLAIPMHGPTGLREIVSQHVTMDLRDVVQDDQALLTYFVRPGGNGTFAGTLCAMGPDRWGRDSTEWAVHIAFEPGDPAAHDRAGLLLRVRELLGVEDLEVDVHSVTHWTFEGLVAERFRRGRVLLIGNAAHRHPPTGGLGLNCAVQDAHNLAWKLQAVIEGFAPDELLDSYETERQPVAQHYVDHSLANAGAHARIGAALGLEPGQSDADGWAAIAAWQSETPEGARRRRAVDEAVAANADDYGQLNVEVGFAYAAGAVVPDGTPPPETHDTLQEYTATTRPGHHLPHAWVVDGGSRRSTVDLIAPRGLTLIVTGRAADVWSAAAVAVDGQRLSVVAIGEGAAIEDLDGTWEAVRGITASGALLVRPDRHVAARITELPADPVAVLTDMVDAVLGTTERVA